MQTPAPNRIVCALKATLFLLLCTASRAQNPIPQIVGPAEPIAVAPGSGAFTLSVYGANFVPGAIVNWNGQPRSTAFVSGRELQAQILAADIATNTAGMITVMNPSPGGGNSSASWAQVEVHTPTATINPRYPYLAPMQFPYGAGPLVMAEFTTEQTLDLVYGSVVALGKGNGKFSFSQLIPDYSTPLGVTFGDFNGDGNLDLAYVAGNYGNLAKGQLLNVMLGDGTGKFKIASQMKNPENGFIWLAAADINGDGKLDLVVAKQRLFAVYLGNGDGTFQEFAEYGAPGTGETSAFTLGDFNGDGILDLMLADGYGDVYLMTGKGDGTLNRPAVAITGSQWWSCPTNDGSPIATDFNGDGKLDLLVCNNSGIGVMLGNGDGTFQPPVLNPVSPQSSFNVAVGDFNSDGKMDVIVSQIGEVTQFSIFLGNGDGTLQPQQIVTLPGKITYDGENGIGAADFNADGLLDFILVDPAGNDVVYVQE